jgi:pimeloyl-ACP methyl ester carboxylesterase
VTRHRLRRAIRAGFILWAVVSTAWLLDSFRTRGVDGHLLEDNREVVVRSSAGVLSFLPNRSSRTGLVFIVGAGVAAEAYAPLLRPVADRGYPVFIVRLPFRIAPLESHKREAIARTKKVIGSTPGVTKWVVAGHSLGGALAARIAAERTPADDGIMGIVLVGTSHPKETDLSASNLRFTKVFGTHDGVAPVTAIEANRHLLPATTRWVRIEGGTHSQFANYGHQLFDGRASISRERQQELTRDALLAALGSM